MCSMQCSIVTFVKYICDFPQKPANSEKIIHKCQEIKTLQMRKNKSREEHTQEKHYLAIETRAQLYLFPNATFCLRRSFFFIRLSCVVQSLFSCHFSVMAFEKGLICTIFFLLLQMYLNSHKILTVLAYSMYRVNAYIRSHKINKTLK